MKKNYALQRIGILTLVSLAIAIINGYFFNYINNKYFHFSSSGNNLNDFSFTSQFIIIILFAPLIETALLQFIPNEILKYLKIYQPFLLVLIPSLLFSMLHYYNWIYVVMTFGGGLILNYYYIKAQNITKNIFYSFLLTALLHSLYNLYGFLFVV